MSEPLTTDEKLTALGLKSPSSQTNPYQDLFTDLSAAVSYDVFVNDMASLTTWDGVENYLTTTVGMSAADASRFRTLLQQKYGTVGAFQTALAEASTYDEWETSFKFGTSIGTTPTNEDPTQAGLRVHSEDGVSFDGIAVPKGTVEIYGPRVEFSNTAASEAVVPDFTYANLSVTDAAPSVGETIEITADVTNNTTNDLLPMVRLLEDGAVVDSYPLFLPAGATNTVSFDRSWSDLVSVDLRIENTAPITVQVVPAGLGGTGSI